MSKKIYDPKKGREDNKRFRERNPEYQKEWRKKNLKRCCAYSRKWQAKNPLRVRKTANIWKKRTYHKSPNFRLRTLLGTRLRDVLHKFGVEKKLHTMTLVGCTIPELWVHLEKQFKPGMTKENYGPIWHVDHIKPCAKFDFTEVAQQRACFHWTNLQPLFARDNLSKGAKV